MKDFIVGVVLISWPVLFVIFCHQWERPESPIKPIVQSLTYTGFIVMIAVGMRILMGLK